MIPIFITLFTSAWSSSPRPESPTGFSRFLGSPKVPKPDIFKNLKPEARPSPNFKPEGYPTGFFQGKIVQKPQKNDVKLEKKIRFLLNSI